MLSNRACRRKMANFACQQMKFDAPIKEDRAEVRKTNKEDRYGFQIKLLRNPYSLYAR